MNLRADDFNTDKDPAQDARATVCLLAVDAVLAKVFLIKAVRRIIETS